MLIFLLCAYVSLCAYVVKQYLAHMKPFLTAHWQNLIMLNYAIDPFVLEKYLPGGTELDIWNGICYVSLVGFMFLNTRVRGISVPFFSNFEEFNLRFYVRFKDGEEWKRGVVFVKEIVPKRIVSSIANSVYGEHYYCYPMKNSLIENDGLIKVKYEWFYKNEWNFIEVTAEEDTYPLIENSEEEFITQHFWGYTKLSNGATSEYHVEHPRWDIHKVVSHNVQCNSKDLYGDDFDYYLKQPPVSAFMARGSDVKVFPRKLWKF